MYVSSLLRLHYYRDWFEVDQSCFVESNISFRMSPLSPTTMPYCCRLLIVDDATGGIR